MNDFADESPDEADDAAFGREHGAQRGQTFESGRDDALDIPFGDEHGARFTGEFDTAPSAGSKDHDGCFPAHGAVESVAREATSGNGLNVDRIPVRLSFDLGEQMLTLGELRRLQPGEYVDLQRRLDAGPVHIRANGSLIGTAELVDIEGRIGARVLTLTLDRGPCF